MTVPTGVMPRVGNLPAALTTFVGRRQEAAEVRRALGTARLLTLTGVGGVGKTRLALEVAAASASASASAADFANGVWLVELAPLLAAHTTATALGVPDLGARPVIEQPAAFLTHRGPLIVLDNCEHLVDACAEMSQTLLPASPGLRILTTSRRALGTFGEHVFTVPPLMPRDAVELLRDRTAAIRPEFKITDGNHTQVLRLRESLDGLPLAIELAASRLQTLSVDEAANRLVDRFGLLTGGNRTARPHQRTLRGLID
ncbi:ATP-binding protein [Streptomyces sp. NPDC056660]|uniref:ATP-binding protein n=1 Tax=Streptomyces sp. NPDC056660 TaxID=3345897 RepID=UPI0036A2BD03